MYHVCICAVNASSGSSFQGFSTGWEVFERIVPIGCRDRGRKGGVAGALCLSWPHRRACHEDKHKAPTPLLNHPLSLRVVDRLFLNLTCMGTARTIPLNGACHVGQPLLQSTIHPLVAFRQIEYDDLQTSLVCL